MTKQQTERLIAAFEHLALSLDSIGRIMEERNNKEFPPAKEPLDAEIFQQGNEEPEPQEALPGRFERAYREAIQEP